MNDMTKAVCEIMDTLDKSRISKITNLGDYTEIELTSYNNYSALNQAMKQANIGYITFPYKVKLSFTIDSKFTKLIEQDIESYKGDIKNYYKRIMDNYKVPNGETCTCSTQQLMIKGCTCGGK